MITGPTGSLPAPRFHDIVSGIMSFRLRTCGATCAREAFFVRFLAVFGCVLLIPALAAGAERASPDARVPITVLDGEDFTGKVIPADRSETLPDDFIFRDGKFHSRACLEWGFEPGPYWVRIENGQVHFLARLTSDENGVITYRGTVDGAKLISSFEWVKPRWYWTMKRRFTFSGSRGEGAARTR